MLENVSGLQQGKNDARPSHLVRTLGPLLGSSEPRQKSGGSGEKVHPCESQELKVKADAGCT